MKIWLVAAALALGLAAPALAQSDAEVTAALDANFGDAAPFVEAFDAIQAAVADGDAQTFAEWISYPFRTMVDGEDYRFDGPEAVVEHYDALMTDEIRSAIVDQQFKDLFVNADGVMFGDGQVWLNGVCANSSCTSFDVKIITVQSTAN